jgi:hypothetical protein
MWYCCTCAAAGELPCKTHIPLHLRTQVKYSKILLLLLLLLPAPLAPSSLAAYTAVIWIQHSCCLQEAQGGG